MLFARLLRSIIDHGGVTVVDHRGEKYPVGTDSSLVVRLHDASVSRQLFLDPELVLGEAYVNGRLTVENGDIYDFLSLLLSNLGCRPSPRWWRILSFVRSLLERPNIISRSRANAAAHYDLSSRLYDLFLDSDRQYSCAYFIRPTDTLEQAQLQKKAHIAAKLLIEPGMRVLDIGSGWGGLALYLSEHSCSHVVGISLSEEQYHASTKRTLCHPAGRNVEFRLQDYREVAPPFDRIVSVGMFEHVGRANFPCFFERLHKLLADDGVALLHTIGSMTPSWSVNPWMRKYIFPGGYIPTLSEVARAAANAGLYVTDVEVLRLHYARTLREWRKRFRANWEAARMLYDERFCRMWDFYLAASQAAFEYWGVVVFQIQLAKTVDAVPTTRDYIWAREQALLAEDERPKNDRVAALGGSKSFRGNRKTQAMRS